MAEKSAAATSPNVPALVPTGAHAGNSPLRLAKTVVLVGSEDSSHLRLVSSTISRYHALILTGPEGVVIRDLISRTKVFVNGQAVRETALRDGDQLALGRFGFKFMAPAGGFAQAQSIAPASLSVEGMDDPIAMPGHVLLIGRQPGCDIEVPDDAVSTRHAVIFDVGGKRFVRDLDSRTGTILNGKKIHQSEIKIGDELHIGGSVVKLIAASSVPKVVKVAAPVKPDPQADNFDISTDPDVADIPGQTAMMESISDQPRVPILPTSPRPVPEPVAEIEPEIPAPPAAAGESKQERGWRRTTWEAEQKAAATPAPAPVPVPVPKPEPAPVLAPFEDIELPPLEPDVEATIALEASPPAQPEEAAPESEAPDPMEEEAVAPVVMAHLDDVPRASAGGLDERDQSEDGATAIEPAPEPFEDIEIPPLGPEIEAPIAIEAPVQYEEAAPEVELLNPMEEEPAAPMEIEALPVEEAPGEVEPVAEVPVIEEPEVGALEPLAIEPLPLEFEPKAEEPKFEESVLEPLPVEPVPQEMEPVAEISEIAPPVEVIKVQEMAPEPIISEPVAEGPAVEIASPAPKKRGRKKKQTVIEAPAIAPPEFANLEINLHPESEQRVAEPAAEILEIAPAPQIEQPLIEIESSVVGAEPIEPAPEPAEGPIQGLQISAQDFAGAAPSSTEEDPRPGARDLGDISEAEPVEAEHVADADLMESIMPPAIEAREDAQGQSEDDLALEALSSGPTDHARVAEEFAEGSSEMFADELALDALNAAAEKMPGALDPQPVEMDEPAVDRIAALKPRPARQAGVQPVETSAANDADSAKEQGVHQPSERGWDESASNEESVTDAGRELGEIMPREESVADAGGAFDENSSSEERIADPGRGLGENELTDKNLVEAAAVNGEPVNGEPVNGDSLHGEAMSISTDEITFVPPPGKLAASIPASVPGTGGAIFPPPLSTSFLPPPIHSIPTAGLHPPLPPARPAPTPQPEVTHWSDFSLDDDFFGADIRKHGGQVSGPLSPSGSTTTHGGAVPPPRVAPPPRIVPSRPPVVPEALHSLGNTEIFGGTGHLTMPIHLKPEEGPPEHFGKGSISFDQPVAKAPRPQSESAVLEAPPEAEESPVGEMDFPVAEPAPEPEPIAPPPLRPAPAKAAPKQSPPKAAPPKSAAPKTKPLPRPRLGPSRTVRPATFATQALDENTEDLMVPPPGAARANLPIMSAFDGLALPTASERDVFSDIGGDASAGRSTLLGQAASQAPTGGELQQAFDANTDFADDDFWNRTDAQDEALGLIKPETVVTEQPPAPRSAPPRAPMAEAPEPVGVTDEEISQLTAEPDEDSAISSGETDFTDEQINPNIEAPSPVEESPIAEEELPEYADAPEPVADEPEPIAEQPEAAIPTAQAAPRRKTVAAVPMRRASRRRYVPLVLLLLMLITMGGAVGAILLLWPPKTHVMGAMTYLNFNWVDNTDTGNEFAAQQRRLMEDPHTAEHATNVLAQQHPGEAGGFLGNRQQYIQVVDGFTLSTNRINDIPQTTMRLNFDGADGSREHDRMLALLQAIYEVNAPAQDENRHKREMADKARQHVGEVEANVGSITDQINAQQNIIKDQPSDKALAALDQKAQQLHKAKQDASDVMDNDRSSVSKLQSGAVAAVGGAAASTQAAGSDAATSRPSADPQLQQMRQQMDDLTARLSTAKAEQTTAAQKARVDLEDTAKQFNDQITAAGAKLDDSSDLKKYLNSVQDSQAHTRDLIQTMLTDGQDLQKQLEETRRDMEESIQNRQQQIWSADMQLQHLQESLDSAQHRYNAAVGQGIKDATVLDPLQREIDGITDQVKARQSQLGVDPSDVKVEEGLTKLLDEMRNKLGREKQQLDDVLTPMEKQLSDLNPIIAALPASQQDMAKQIRDKLDALNKARLHYSDAVGEGATAPSNSVTELQKQIDDLKGRFDRRQADLTAQIQVTVAPEQGKQVADAQHVFDMDKQAYEKTKSEYDAASLDYDRAMIRHENAQAATAKVADLQKTLSTAKEEQDAARRDSDQKQTAANATFELRQPIESDIVIRQSLDPRRDYSLFAIAGLAVIFAIMAILMPRGDRYDLQPNMPLPAQIELTRAVLLSSGNETGEPRAHDDDEGHEAMPA